jgi:hypothetical protein
MIENFIVERSKLVKLENECEGKKRRTGGGVGVEKNGRALLPKVSWAGSTHPYMQSGTTPTSGAGRSL